MKLPSAIENRITTKYAHCDKEAVSIARMLFLVDVALSFLSLLVFFIIRTEGPERILLFAMFAYMFVLAALVLAGKAKTASVMTSLFLSIAFSSMTFMRSGYAGYVEFYLIGFLNLFAMGVTLLIAYRPWQVLLIPGAATVAVFSNLFLRAIPACRLTGESVQYDDAIIVAVLVTAVAACMNGVMGRIKGFLALSNESATQSLRQLEILRDAMEASTAAFAQGERLADSASRTSQLARASTDTVKNAETSMRELDGNSRLLDEELEKIGMSSAKARESAEMQSSVINETSAAIEEMTASIRSINAVTRERKGAVKELSASTGEGSRIVAESSRSMGAVESSTGAILDVIKVISSVAAQTNLLAMNAAIEAAHAGESGRGFAVVADEIRKLSEQTSASVKTVTDTVKGTISDIRKAADGNDKAVASFATIAKEAELVSGAMDEIIDGLDELAKGTDEINRGVSDSVTSTNTLREAVSSLDAEIANARKSLDSLKAAAGKVDSDLSGVISTIDSISAEAQQVDGISRINAEGLGTLKAALDKAGL